MEVRGEEDRTKAGIKGSKDRIKVKATWEIKVEEVKQARLRDATLNLKGRMLIWTLLLKKMKNPEVENQKKGRNPEDPEQIAPCYKAG
jgi:hypothetical protein